MKHMGCLDSNCVFLWCTERMKIPTSLNMLPYTGNELTIHWFNINVFIKVDLFKLDRQTDEVQTDEMILATYETRHTYI
jgi:hypothetical protein